MAANAREIIEGLQEEIHRIERRTPQRVRFASCGRPEVDALLPGGGFPRGALTELTGGHASGKTALALSALATAMGQDGLAAFVDGRGELYPPAAAAFGVDLDRLLVVRPLAPGHEDGKDDAARRALWAAEVLLSSGAFEAVAMDVPIEGVRHRMAGTRAGSPGALPPRACLAGMLRRLRAAVEKGGAVGVWLGVPGSARVPSAVRLELSAGAAGLQVRRTFAREAEEAQWPQFRRGTSPLHARGEPCSLSSPLSLFAVLRTHPPLPRRV